MPVETGSYEIRYFLKSQNGTELDLKNYGKYFTLDLVDKDGSTLEIRKLVHEEKKLTDPGETYELMTQSENWSDIDNYLKNNHDQSVVTEHNQSDPKQLLDTLYQTMNQWYAEGKLGTPEHDEIVRQINEIESSLKQIFVKTIRLDEASHFQMGDTAKQPSTTEILEKMNKTMNQWYKEGRLGTPEYDELVNQINELEASLKQSHCPGM